jgi:hypothetical protein
MLVEFLIVVTNLASGDLEPFEIELDDILRGRQIKTAFAGSGARTEAA